MLSGIVGSADLRLSLGVLAGSVARRQCLGNLGNAQGWFRLFKKVSGISGCLIVGLL